MRQGVERRGGAANGVHEGRGKTPRSGGSVACRLVEELADGSGDDAGVAGEAHRVPVLEEGDVPCGTRRRAEEAGVTGEAEDAAWLQGVHLVVVVVDGGAGLAVRAHLLRVLEGGGEAVCARGGVDGVAAAECERAHHAGGGGGEELRGGGGVGREGGGQHGEAGLEGGVGRVVAAAAAGDPDRRCRRRHEEDEEQQQHARHAANRTWD